MISKLTHNTAVVKRKVDHGANVNNADLSSKDSALHFAAHFNRPEILKMLLAKGADYTALECNRRSLAHCTARTGSPEFVKIMAEAKLERLDLGVEGCVGKTAGSYMDERIVMTDCKVGVHEEWEAFVESLPRVPPPPYEQPGNVGEESDDVAEDDAGKLIGDDWKVPGAFSAVMVQEVL